jgi:hypothetical protein
VTTLLALLLLGSTLAATGGWVLFWGRSRDIDGPALELFTFGWRLAGRVLLALGMALIASVVVGAVVFAVTRAISRS